MEIPFFWECLKSLLPVSSRRCGQGYGTGVYCAARKGDDSINERIEGGCHGGGFAWPRLHRRAVLARGRYRRLVGADLSHTAGPTGRALWGRRSDRCDRAHRRAEIAEIWGSRFTPKTFQARAATPAWPRWHAHRPTATRSSW